MPVDHEHGPSLMLARSEVGSVSMCSCGVLTLTLQYLSLRFEPGAFRELQSLLASAQSRVDGRRAAVLHPVEPSPEPVSPGPGPQSLAADPALH